MPHQCCRGNGKPFKEDSGDLLVLDTMEIMPEEVVQSVKNLQKLGEGQYKAFVKERLIDSSKPITETIKRNNVALFSRPPGKTRSKKQAQVSEL